MNTIRDWNTVRHDVHNLLRSGHRRKVYRSKDFISEVSFTVKLPQGGIRGSSYMSDICAQALLRRIAKERAVEVTA